MELIVSERLDRTARLSFQFNDRNTVTAAALDALEQHLAALEGDQALRAVIFRSNQPGFFSNGLDPALFLDRTESEVRANWSRVFAVFERMLFFPRPTFAELNGHAMALGAVWALACDFRFMAERGGRIGFPEALISMNFPATATMLLKDVVGSPTARRLLYGGSSLKAPDALRIGLVDEVFSIEALSEQTLKRARAMSSLTADSARGIKRALQQGYRTSFEHLIAWDLGELVAATRSPNAQEGFRSLAEGRRPRFPEP